MARLIAIDQPAGPDFVAELRRIWDAGDAAVPIDQRLPKAARDELRRSLRVGDEVEPGDALVVATSGSTGAPKGVVLTHDAVAASAEATSRRIGVRPDDHWLACLPLAHVGGLSVVTRALHTGAKLTVLAAFDPDRVMASEATLVSLVATALQRIDPTRFRAILLGGARPPDDRPANSITTYGMTETGSGVVYDGVPLDNVEIRITDARHRRDVDGDIEIRGPMLLRSYRDGSDPKSADGWLATGDVGRWLPDGRLHVVGRRGDMIITGGENVWPEAVEAALADHRLVHDVMVRGVDDPEWGQIVDAVVVPAGPTPPTLQSLRDHVKQRHPAFMAPRRITLASDLPRTNLGKLRRGPIADASA
ncbi:MAG: class I adenylate-forming enzyme family protein [Ilumatobacter sp.]|uniref:class I adenylate-forming enzyme family protein n=1 Tax=Ilumatobacter sp. TaxID=1967498 RepID=UPI00391D8801